MSPITFTFNVAFSIAVNSSLPSHHPDHLSPAELWEGIKRGGRHPEDFAPYVAKCDELEGDSHNFIRRLTLDDGAVHTASGETLDQKVIIAEGLHVEATTLDTGAKSTWLMSRDAAMSSSESSSLLLVAAYELKLSNVEPGSEKAAQIERDYTELTYKACRQGAETIRTWKREGKLEKWRLEHEKQ